MQRLSKGKSSRFLLVAFTLLCLPQILLSQSSGGAQVSGTIADQLSAVVPKAEIKMTQTDTGQVRTTVSSASGAYVFPNLQVGPYTLEVIAQGFQHHVQSGIVLTVGNDIKIDIALQLGSISQEVRVFSEANLVQTQETSISDLVDQQRIVDLPLNGRQATQLILLSGGAASSPAYAGGGSLALVTTKTYSGSVAISVAGQQPTGNNFLLDGGDNNDAFSNVNLPFPFPDALQEFNVQTSGLSAQYGIHPGAAVNILTKSGTNRFHGDLFEFVRNGSFNARNYFATAQDTLHRNQFGGTIGGPLKRDTLFGFFGYQNTIQRTAPPQTIGFVPTQAALSGDFSSRESAACQSSGKARVINDPSTGLPFANSHVSPSLFSPQALALLKYVPVSSDPCGKLTYRIPTPSDETQYVGRADWVQSTKHTVFARYLIANVNNPPFFDGINVLTAGSPGTEQRSQSLVVGDTYTFSSSVVNNIHLTGTRFKDNRSASPNFFSPKAAGINITSFVPNFSNLTISSAFNIGSGNGAPAHFNRNTFQFTDDAILIRGRHQISMGVDYIYRQLNEFNVFLGNGAFTFNGQFTKDPLLDFMLGRPNTFSQGNPEQTGVRQNYIALYGQDNFQLNSKLNIHLGLRWEPLLPERDVAGRGSYFSQSAFDGGQKTSKYTNAPAGLLFAGDQGVPSSYVKGKLDNFSPRVGLVFDPAGNGKQSIRASYNVFHDTPNLYFYAKWADAAPWGSTITLTPPGTLADIYGNYPGGNPFPFPFPPSKSQPFPTGATYYSFPINTRPTYAQIWSLSYQRQLGKDWLVSADYVGSKTTHLWSGTDQNHAVYIPGLCSGQPCSTLTNTNQRRLLYLQSPAAGLAYGQVQTLDEGNYSNYHGLILKTRHRFAQHYTAVASYTYSHCLQDGEVESNDLGNNGPSFQNPLNRGADYGPCDADLRHAFVGSFVIDSPRPDNKLVRAVLGNWEVSPIITAQVGTPFTPMSGIDNSRTSIGQDRPNLVSDPYLRKKSTRQWLNPAAYVQNPVGTFGNAGWNSLNTPGYVSVDAALIRTLSLPRELNMQLRFEAFNVLNHTNFGQPSNNFSTSTFGTIFSSNPARIIQLAAKLTF